MIQQKLKQFTAGPGSKQSERAALRSARRAQASARHPHPPRASRTWGVHTQLSHRSFPCPPVNVLRLLNASYAHCPSGPRWPSSRTEVLPGVGGPVGWVRRGPSFSQGVVFLSPGSAGILWGARPLSRFSFSLLPLPVGSRSNSHEILLFQGLLFPVSSPDSFAPQPVPQSVLEIIYMHIALEFVNLP